MNTLLSWILRSARDQTLALLDGVAEERSREQAVADQQHPAWIAGHLLLADVYLLHLLRGDPLPEDFPVLLRLHGPGGTPSTNGEYASLHVLSGRLAHTGELRCAIVCSNSYRKRR